jgi:amidase
MLLDVLAGYEVGDATWAPRPTEPYSTAVRRDPGRLRVAMTTTNPLGVDVDPECVRGMRVAADLLASLGHDVEEAAPAFPGGDVLGLFIKAFGPAVALGIGYGELLAGRPPTEDEIEPLSRLVYERAQQLTSVGYLAAAAQLQAVARGIVAFFAEYDLLLTPALAERPLAIGECTGYGDDPMADLARSGRFAPHTALFNVTGQPAITMPLGFGDDGLPTAAQIVAKPLGEDTLLQVAAQMEAALGRPSQIPDL